MLGLSDFSRPFHGLRLTFARHSPAMNRWAILIRPQMRTGFGILFGRSRLNSQLLVATRKQMKSLLINMRGAASLLVLIGLILPSPASAQNGHLTKLTEVRSDAATAQALYEEANNYLDKKFAEFNKQKLAYDAKLDSTTKQEQKDLAARNAALLEARGNLKDTDRY